MNEMVKNITNSSQESLFRQWWNSRNFVQQRLIRFCLSMLTMVVCFPLYYLGLFGSVEGPLNAASIGETFAGMGVTQAHGMVFFLSLLMIAVSWNWIFNAVSYAMGSRLTCNRKMDTDGTVCGAPVKREKVLQKKTGHVTVRYACSEGHLRQDAHFHPVKKGTFSHTLWVISLCFCVIVFFMS
jgi:hypothetical protein